MTSDSDQLPPPVTVCVTVRNEGTSIDALLQSIAGQSHPADAVVIVDGGSTDDTPDRLRAWESRLPGLLWISAPGANISRGRNLAIERASTPVVAVTDAGVRLDREWLAHLLRPFASANPTDVASGFFVADPRSTFELALGATTLPLVDEIEPTRFLPSSRSVAFTREAWEHAGGYPEWLDFCEDLVFDLALRDGGFRFAWAPRAVVRFRPRRSVREFFTQYYRYARGDGKADLWRTRHAIRYATYVLGPVGLAASISYPWVAVLVALAALAYVLTPLRRLMLQRRGWERRQLVRAACWIPAIRLIGDVAKMLGYPVGVVWRSRNRR